MRVGALIISRSHSRRCWCPESRVGMHSEAGERDFQLMLYHVACDLKRIPIRLDFLSMLLSGKSTTVN